LGYAEILSRPKKPFAFGGLRPMLRCAIQASRF
jgi:hypothetical protein